MSYSLRTFSLYDLLKSSAVFFRLMLGCFMLLTAFVLGIIFLFRGPNAPLMTLTLIFAFFGAFLFVFSYRSYFKLKEKRLEKQALKAAADNNGILTVSKLAIRSGLSTEKSKKILDKLNLAGVAEIGANEQGAITYTFHDLLEG